MRQEVGVETGDAPLVVDGVEMLESISPKSADELATMLGELRSAGAAALLRGAGTRLELGNVPARACHVLELSALSGIECLEREDGVVQVRAGTPLASLREACAAEGWELPLPVPDARSTVGAAIATGALGARSLGFGPVRDAVLGLEVVLATGERTKCGGRVVKNVTGYDLAKLYTGSLGRLGVVTSAWLRLHAPAQERRRMEARLELAAGGEARTTTAAFEAALATARRETACATLLHHPPRGESDARLIAEFAGDAASVELDARAFAADFGATDPGATDPGATDPGDTDPGATDLPESPSAAAFELESLDFGLAARALARVRISGAASQLSAAVEMLVAAGVELVVHPGTGVAVAWSDDAAALVAAADAARAIHGVGSFFERLPAEQKQQRDVFSLSAAEFSITRALVTRFDPEALLNPGRFAGHL